MNSGQENAPVRSIRCSIAQLRARFLQFFAPGRQLVDFLFKTKQFQAYSTKRKAFFLNIL